MKGNLSLHLSMNNYRLKLILEHTWHVEAKVWSKCQQAVEEQHNKSENNYRWTKTIDKMERHQ